jgi:hypothetical protein
MERVWSAVLKSFFSSSPGSIISPDRIDRNALILQSELFHNARVIVGMSGPDGEDLL